MDIRVGGRATGKTYKIVKKAAEANGILVVTQNYSKLYIEAVSRELGIDPPTMFTVQEVMEGYPLPLPIIQRNLYIDNLEDSLYQVFQRKYQIKEANVCPESTEILFDSYLKDKPKKPKCSECEEYENDFYFCPHCGREND